MYAKNKELRRTEDSLFLGDTVGTEIITTDPGERTDGDTTTWAYDEASGLELLKTYPDGASENKTYNAFGQVATETDARGVVKTMSYDTATGQLTGVSFSDDTTDQTFAYNVQRQLTEVSDASGTRTFGYNEYGEPETESLDADGVTHLLTELRDDCGRSAGFTCARDGETLHTVFTGYGTDGRVSAAGFVHGGEEKEFGYGYLEGSHLLETLTMPNGMSLTQGYEEKRDLLTGMTCRRGTTGVVIRNYSYDTLGRPVTRSTSRQGATQSDTFTHDSRDQLASASVNGTSHGFDYDNIGNRRNAIAGQNYAIYSANNLNQYSAIRGAEAGEE